LVIGPGDVDLDAAEYVSGMCPIAEQQASKALNLPTNMHIQDSDVERIVAAFTE